MGWNCMGYRACASGAERSSALANCMSNRLLPRCQPKLTVLPARHWHVHVRTHGMLLHQGGIKFGHARCTRGLDATVGVTDVLLPKKDEIVNAQIVSKLGDLVLAGAVHGDANHLKTLRPVLLLQLLKPAHLDLAGLAPGCPEIQKHGLAVEVRKAHSCAVERFQREVGCHLLGEAQ